MSSSAFTKAHLEEIRRQQLGHVPELLETLVLAEKHLLMRAREGLVCPQAQVTYEIVYCLPDSPSLVSSFTQSHDDRVVPVPDLLFERGKLSAKGVISAAAFIGQSTRYKAGLLLAPFEQDLASPGTKVICPQTLRGVIHWITHNEGPISHIAVGGAINKARTFDHMESDAYVQEQEARAGRPGRSNSGVPARFRLRGGPVYH